MLYFFSVTIAEAAHRGRCSRMERIKVSPYFIASILFALRARGMKELLNNGHMSLLRCQIRGVSLSPFPPFLMLGCRAHRSFITSTLPLDAARCIGASLSAFVISAEPLCCRRAATARTWPSLAARCIAVIPPFIGKSLLKFPESSIAWINSAWP